MPKCEKCGVEYAEGETHVCAVESSAQTQEAPAESQPEEASAEAQTQ